MKSKINNKLKYIFKNKYLFILFIIILLLLLFYTLLIYTYNKEKFENNRKIPKKIFTYWNEVEITNPFVKKNIEYIKSILPSDFEFIVYNENSIQDELGEDMKYNNHDMSTPTNFSDFIRYYLIYKYGGIWIDSTYFILDFEKAILNKYKDYENIPFNAGYYEFTDKSIGTNINEKYYESWFMMAPQNDPYIRDVLNEFKEAATIGFPNYKKKLREDHINLKNLIEEEDNFYLMIYAIVRNVLTKNQNYKIKTFDINNVLFNYWDDTLLNELLNSNSYKKYEAIKLTGLHREIIDKNNKENDFLETLDHYYKNNF